MTTHVIDDGREYIFPLLLVDSHDNSVDIDSRKFLGTAFFVTKQADAVTAGHVLPNPADLPDGKKVIAVIQQGEEQHICWLTHAALFEKWDLALLHVNINNTKYLPLSDENVFSGSDIVLIGIPNHEVWNAGKEMRILKGHVTLVTNQLELNFPIPLGMSGSPVLLDGKVVAYAVGTLKGEEIASYEEEVELLSNNKEQIRISKVIQLTHYGMAYSFAQLKEQVLPAFEGKTLMQVIEARNA